MFYYSITYFDELRGISYPKWDIQFNVKINYAVV